MTIARTATPAVLVAHDRPDDFAGLLAERFPRLRFEYATNGEAVLEKLASLQPQVVLSLKNPAFPGPMHKPIMACPSVRWVQIGGSGYDHMVPWDTGRLTVTNCAGVLARYLAETVTGAMLMLNGHFLKYLAQQRQARWVQGSFRPLCDQTLLVVGVGAIGGFVADNAKALGMRVLGIRRQGGAHRSVDAMYRFDQFLAALPEADVVSLHVRVAEQTRHLIDARSLAAMRPGSILINTSRGPVVDESALIRALESGHLRAAYLDVFETEPLPSSSPLWRVENLFLTPHVSDSVTDWPLRYAAFFADNLDRWLRGERLANTVHERFDGQ
jgi:phosphoglycerate dehydrogenase-like enzyme